MRNGSHLLDPDPERKRMGTSEVPNATSDHSVEENQRSWSQGG